MYCFDVLLLILQIFNLELEKYKNKKYKNEIKILNFFKIDNIDKD